jgi:DNA-binding beta-propeller fold protein YncE
MLSNVWSVMLLAYVPGASADLQVVVDKLDRPCGVAVQPETGHVFVSESGTGRVLRVVEGRVEPAIVGLGVAAPDELPRLNVSPSGLAFVNRDTLAVGTGDRAAAEDELLFFSLPTAGSPAVESRTALARYLTTANDADQVGGNYWGAVGTTRALFATCHESGTQGWLVRVALQGGQPLGFDRFLALSPLASASRPAAITISPRGELVVGLMGEAERERDARVVFLSINSRRLLLNLPAGLHDITGLTYGSDGQLYATDLAWHKPADGGLFQLVSVLMNGKQSIEPRRVAALMRPTAVATTHEGVLYVTTLGDTDAAGSTGTLWKVTRR